MQWNACSLSMQWSVGADIQVSRFLLDGESPSIPAVHDSLVIEFPDNSRAAGTVVNSTPAQIVVNANGASWRLNLSGAPLNVVNGQLRLNYVVSENV